MKKKIAYSAYIIAITLFFLYTLFPGDAVTAYINHQVNKMYPGMTLSIQDLKPGFPADLKLSAVNISHHNQPLVGADRVAVRLALPSMFSVQKTIIIAGDFYGGHLDSTLRIAEIRMSPKFDIEGLLSGVQIGGIPAIQRFENYQISGTLGGNMIFSNTEPAGGKGSATLTVKDSAVGFTPALFGLERLTFETIDADLELINQRLMIKRLEVESRDVSGTATGSVMLQNPVEKSTINIQGGIKPHPSFIKQLGSIFPVEFMAKNKSKTGGIPFRITGSLEQPNFSLK